MKKVYTARNPQEAFLVSAALEAEGIRARIENEHLFSVRGGIPMGSETLPEVWVIDAAQYDDALAIIAGLGSQHGEGALGGHESTHESAHEMSELEDANEDERLESLAVERSGPLSARWLLYLLLVLSGFFLGIAYGRRAPESDQGWDWNRDGQIDHALKINADSTCEFTADQNFDGRADAKTHCDEYGAPVESWVDSDFDGNFDTRFLYANGIVTRGLGFRSRERPTIVENRFEHGILTEQLVDDDEDGEYDSRLTFDHIGRVTGQESLIDRAEEFRRALDPLGDFRSGSR